MNHLHHKANAIYATALAAHQQGAMEQAIALYHQAVQLCPGHVDAYSNLGAAYAIRNQFAEAMACFKTILQYLPHDAKTHHHIGLVYKQQGQYSAAVDSFHKSIQFDDRDFKPHLMLGEIFVQQNQWRTAEFHLLQALARKPDLLPAYIQLSDLYIQQGQFKPHFEYLQKATTLPQCPNWLYSRFVYHLLHHPDFSQEEVFAYFKAWEQRYVLSQPFPPQIHDNKPEPQRRLKIGYVSADFRYHGASNIWRSLYEQHDRNNFEIYSYAHHLKAPDDNTTFFQSLSGHWRDVTALSDQEMAKQINQDGIDILVDLSGHSAGNRLHVFAQKPAPIQISGLTFFYTTGVSAIDYRWSDRWITPPEKAHLSSEKIIYLSYLPHLNSPTEWASEHPIQDPPMLTKGALTLGCTSNPLKINEQVLHVWARILQAIPQSTLHFKFRGFESLALQQYYQAIFAEYQIEPDRLMYFGYSPLQEHLEFYQTVDFVLDPFPYNGGLTTVDALWMGCPFITMAGGMNVGVSMANAMAQPDWVAHSPEDYVAKGVSLGHQPNLLKTLRYALRERLLASPICDTQTLTQEVETSYRKVWGRWCEQRAS